MIERKRDKEKLEREAAEAGQPTPGDAPDAPSA
jgi:hypothetical protein